MPSKPPPAPTRETLLRHFPWVVVRFRCHYCQRAGDVRLALLASRYGHNATLGSLLDLFAGGCAWSPSPQKPKERKYGHKCGAHMPDIGRDGPPDLPPVMMKLRLIEGGRGDMLPAERGERRRRRRIGGDE